MFPRSALPTSPGVFLLYFTAAKMINSVTRTEKNKQVKRINEKSVSTFPAKLDACSGKNGSGDCTALMCSLHRQILARFPGSVRPMLAAAENHNPEDHAQQRHNSAHADNGQYRGAVAGFGRVVLVTEQQNMIHRRADFPGGGVHQAEADIAGR